MGPFGIPELSVGWVALSAQWQPHGGLESGECLELRCTPGPWSWAPFPPIAHVSGELSPLHGVGSVDPLPSLSLGKHPEASSEAASQGQDSPESMRPTWSERHCESVRGESCQVALGKSVG